MAAFVALLRAVNLPGRPLAMSALRSMAEEAGLEEVRTLLQSGNLVFKATSRMAAGIESVLEREAATKLGLQTDFMVRSADEMKTVVDRNPFADAARDDPGHLVVSFLKSEPSTGDVEALRSAIRGREVIEARGRELYIFYRDGIGRSKLTAALMDSKLKARGTGRNWNTVLKLAGMVRQ